MADYIRFSRYTELLYNVIANIVNINRCQIFKYVFTMQYLSAFYCQCSVSTISLHIHGEHLLCTLDAKLIFFFF